MSRILCTKERRCETTEIQLEGSASFAIRHFPTKGLVRRKMKVLNFGSLNLDYVYKVEHMVQAGETLAAKSVEIFCGGKGLNQSIALARAGISVFHAGMIGREGEMLLKMCKDNGVDVSYIRQTRGQSGHTVIQVDESGENCILLYGGANQEMTREFAEEVLEHFGQGDMIVLQNEINLTGYLIDRAYEKRMKIVLNPSPFGKSIADFDMAKVSLFFINEIEGEQMTGEKDPEMILDSIRNMYPDAGVVLTLGESGSIYQDKNKRIRQSSVLTKAVDTTAAGDTFTGYFLSSIINGQDEAQALFMAAKAASVAVSKKGAAASIPYLQEVPEKK